MALQLGRVTVLVDDQDEALEFYTDVLGFEVLADDTTDGFRALHVGTPGDPGVGVWLLPATSDEARERVGAQTAGEPLFVCYTDDIEADYADLDSRGVTFHGEPTSGDTGTHAHFEDLYGNRAVLVELD